MTVADQVNQERLTDRFLELACVNAPSSAEKPMAQITQSQLETMGFSVEYDDADIKTGGNSGNLFAYWEGTDSNIAPLFLSTHLDTVLPTAELKPQIRDGVIYSDGTTILGADDRAALASYIEAIEVIQSSGVRCAPIELLLTVSEQNALFGARMMDYSKVRAKHGFIFDSSGDVGQIILRGPYGKRIYWHIKGEASHLGLAAAEGISAIQIAAQAITQMNLGQVDDLTVANVGLIEGGELPSIIPPDVKMVGEVRSYTEDGMEAQVQHMRDAVNHAAQLFGGKVEVELEKKYLGYHYEEDDPHVQIAVRAAQRIGVKPYFTDTLGGADTNIFIENGLTVFTLGNGFRNIHSFNEHISIENLVNTARLSVGLIEEYTETYG